MQYIQYMQGNEKFYRKPSVKRGEAAYKPIRKNKNSWRFANPINSNPSKEVYEMGMRYFNRMQDPKQRPRKRFNSPAALVKVLFWIYNTGCRQQEVFKKPYPTMDIHSDASATWIEISHQNQKQKKESKRRIDYIIPVFNEWEQMMWNFITDGGKQTQAEAVFQYKNWPSTKNDNISKLFNRNFRTTLIDDDDPQQQALADEGITPHILRHARAYDVLVNHHIDKSDVIKMFGWSNDIMVYYYADIAKRLSKEQQLKRFREAGLLTNLKIDAADILLQSPKRGF